MLDDSQIAHEIDTQQQQQQQSPYHWFQWSTAFISIEQNDMKIILLKQIHTRHILSWTMICVCIHYEILNEEFSKE